MNPAMNHIRDQRERKLPSPQGMYILNLLRITDHPYLEKYPATAVSNSPCAQQEAIIGKISSLDSVQADHCGCQIASLVDSNSYLRPLLFLTDVTRVVGENGNSPYLSILQCQPNGINYQDGT
jgi:hypothetical protein